MQIVGRTELGDKLDVLIYRRRTVHFRDLDVRQGFHGLHRFRRTLRVAKGCIPQQIAAELSCLVDGVTHPQPEQTVPGMEMMVDEL